VSQIKWTCSWKGEELEVITGWDRPLQDLFLTVISTGPTDTDHLPCVQDEDEDEKILIDLGLGDPRRKTTLHRIRLEIEALGIPYPPDLYETLEAHRQSNAGNLFTNHGRLTWPT
jgi:hypothetical protein